MAEQKSGVYTYCISFLFVCCAGGHAVWLHNVASVICTPYEQPRVCRQLPWSVKLESFGAYLKWDSWVRWYCSFQLLWGTSAVAKPFTLHQQCVQALFPTSSQAFVTASRDSQGSEHAHIFIGNVHFIWGCLLITPSIDWVVWLFNFFKNIF